MAIFLSRIKRALNVGSKNITNNGTYYASADGYDGYDEVTVNVSGGSATPITPSNANPVALSSGVAVEPTANGYAIQSYDNITPPSSPQAISSGDILKMIGNGYVIDTYSTATPSDSTPPQLSQGGIYIPTSNGYLYENQQGGSTETVLWTNGSPTSQFAAQTITLSDDYSNYDYIEVYFRLSTSDDTEYRDIIPKVTLDKSNSSNTFAIGNAYSNSTRARGSYVNGASMYFTAAYPLTSTSTTNSYVIPTKIVGISVSLPPSVGNVKTGTFTNTAGTNTTVTCGFKPKKIFIYNMSGANTLFTHAYDEDIANDYSMSGYRTSSSSANCNRYSVASSTTNGTIQEITSTGFVFRGSSVSFASLYYVAIG